jgi:hypothetical protein
MSSDGVKKKSPENGWSKLYEKDKAYIILSSVGVGKTKKIEIEFINVSDDTQILTLGAGVHWFCKNNMPLCHYIGMRELEKEMFGKEGPIGKPKN